VHIIAHQFLKLFLYMLIEHYLALWVSSIGLELDVSLLCLIPWVRTIGGFANQTWNMGKYSKGFA